MITSIIIVGVTTLVHHLVHVMSRGVFERRESKFRDIDQTSANTDRELSNLKHVVAVNAKALSDLQTKVNNQALKGLKL